MRSSRRAGDQSGAGHGVSDHGGEAASHWLRCRDHPEAARREHHGQRSAASARGRPMRKSKSPTQFDRAGSHASWKAAGSAVWCCCIVAMRIPSPDEPGSSLSRSLV